MTALTIVVPYYRQPAMLSRQLLEWGAYPAEIRDQIRIIVIDDGSPAPDEAAPIVDRYSVHLALYRVLTDIPWNQHGARNLGAHVAADGWLLMIDLDHVLLAQSAAQVLELLPGLDAKGWYRFNRRRTRWNEAGELETFDIKPHINSFLVKRDVYWRAGGYDEDYCGCLCGDTQFHGALDEVGSRQHLDVYLDVYGASIVPDAATPYLPRDRAQKEECARRIRDKRSRGDTVAKNPLRFGWERLR